MGNPKPMIRVFALGKLSKILRPFTNENNPLTNMDKSLLKGFYIKNKSMLENHEYIEDEDEVGKFQTIL